MIKLIDGKIQHGEELIEVSTADVVEGVLTIVTSEGMLCVPRADCTADELEVFAAWGDLFPEGKPQPVVALSSEDIYQAKVKDLVSIRYSIQDEIGLTNDAILSQQNGSIIPQTYWDYRAYVEQCKDTAYLEVFGVERT